MIPGVQPLEGDGDLREPIRFSRGPGLEGKRHTVQMDHEAIRILRRPDLCPPAARSALDGLRARDDHTKRNRIRGLHEDCMRDEEEPGKEQETERSETVHG
jgi:hypothetical protein